MSVRLAARRLALSGSSSPSPSSSLLSSPSCAALLLASPPTSSQRRHKWSVDIFRGWSKSGSKDGDGGLNALKYELEDPKKRQQFLERNMHGTVEDNIFQDEIEAAPRAGAAAQEERSAAAQAEQKTRETMAMVTDPDPRARMRWHRKKVIQMIRTNGHVTERERLARTERQLLHQSSFLPTSVKKLVMLSRQIAGKPVDDAIAQMQWSKKKMAAEIKYYLEEARDLAVAQRGMGLGKANGEVLDKPRKIQTKEGKWIDIADPTRMYIAQSWVGRGPWRGKSIDYKGRGRMGVIQHPSTSFTVLLKEEKTRIREHEERVAKKKAKGPWVHHPNRSIHGQRPYYTW
ncbi:39S ribosomal protein L22, mitochondrial [Purpureocillium takamizusanense]|uniref:39S ribosomal protein L22, mitochondrial n=1 Tax=Purpureocillium takamizusanense TaxID=2060973 RepID=A0A9Q8QAZ3_9HYPO|nr:39S ribosomal protein L22, mitochondrial [Purpureocillium takamizusanense]UNI15631.1 39S ribosomal protein L22, mitochondrial [Purpureocillium takamizusanense]